MEIIKGLVNKQVFSLKVCLETLNISKPLWIAVVSLIFSFKSQANPTDLTHESSVQDQDIPYVLLISIDGYRWDYTEKYSPTFISKFKKNKGLPSL